MSADPAGLQARIAELNAELADLRAQLDVAAVAVAEGEAGGAQRLTDVESAISARVRERGVAESALRGLAARDAARATAAEVAAIETAAAALGPAAAEFAAQWRATLQGLRAFASARRGLHAAAGALRRAAASCRDPHAGGELADRPPFDRAGWLHVAALDDTLGRLLFAATDESLVQRIGRGIELANIDQTEAATLRAVETFASYAADVAARNAERLKGAKPAAA